MGTKGNNPKPLKASGIFWKIPQEHNGDYNWKYKLTAYNGATITYDAIGNPTNDGTWTYTWEKGRQLKQMSKSGTTAAFLYNADGLRIRKTVGSTVTNYTLHGKNIVHLTQGSNSLHFFYDAQNRPAIVNYNGTKYAYQYSLQGDVIGLIDSNGTQVVRYVYDAWGKVLSTTGSLASTVGAVQPFRYRGYIYDTETGLYYLRSRYYNPIWQRFLNADTLLENTKILGSNPFIYCYNSPIVYYDLYGKQAVFFDSFVELDQNTISLPDTIYQYDCILTKLQAYRFSFQLDFYQAKEMSEKWLDANTSRKVRIAEFNQEKTFVTYGTTFPNITRFGVAPGKYELTIVEYSGDDLIRYRDERILFMHIKPLDDTPTDLKTDEWLIKRISHQEEEDYISWLFASFSNNTKYLIQK